MTTTTPALRLKRRAYPLRPKLKKEGKTTGNQQAAKPATGMPERKALSCITGRV